MNEKHEIIIVGAGPAGLKCAGVLAESGKKVLVLEKNPQIERKICAGFWGITEKTRRMNLPERVFEKKFRKVIISTPSKKVEVKQENPFVAVICRKKLSEWMHKEAGKSGAEIRFDSQVSKIGRNYVVIKNKKIYFDYLIGADGSNSVVRKALGLKSGLGIGIQYWTRRKFDIPEICLDSEKFLCGYCWIAPYKNKTCIGAGANADLQPTKDLRDNFQNWCKEREFEINWKTFKGAPINYNYQRYNFGNKFLIGDAGGFASGLTGEGIYFAMASGEDVAKIISDKSHKPELINQILKIKKKQEFIADILKVSTGLNKEFGKAEYNLILSLFKINFLEGRAIELVC